MRTIWHRRAVIGACVAALVIGPVGFSLAQTFPSKPVRFIVPFPAGGATDAAARAIQPHMEKILGQTVVIENRAGAGAVIGLDVVAKSAPDGYTIGLAPAGAMSVNPAMNVKMPFDVRKDLAAVTNLAQTPFILAAPASSKFNSLREVIAEAKASPGSLSIGHGGNGTSMYFTALLFTTMADVKVGFVPYRGTILVVNDLVGGHIGLGIVDPPPSQGALLDGRMKGLAISSKQRFAMFPTIPTFDEQGLKGYEVNGWFGIVAPAGTPPEVVTKLNAAIVGALKDAEVAERIRLIGMEPAPSTAAEFAAHIGREIDKIAKVLEQAGGAPPPQ
ncbi:MAG: tripartite tricarboxylate transporter substrate binding protein [Hyphomicrobiales bacterium]|nr:tripartite tricarboxylate transporter substrate binding protein [Alphaproteobacteria bacterium]